MPIESLDDVTGARLRALREERDVSQTEFWGAIGVSRNRGSCYENGEEMPEKVRQLAYLHLVAGIRADMPLSALRRAVKKATPKKPTKKTVRSSRA